MSTESIKRPEKVLLCRGGNSTVKEAQEGKQSLPSWRDVAYSRSQFSFFLFFSSKAPYHDDLRENCIDVQKITHVALCLFSFLWIQRDVSALCDIKKKQLSGLCVVVEPAKK